MPRIRMAALTARASCPSVGKNLNSTDSGTVIQSGMRMRAMAAMNSDTVVVANTKYASASVGTKRETTVAVATMIAFVKPSSAGAANAASAQVPRYAASMSPAARTRPDIASSPNGNSSIAVRTANIAPPFPPSRSTVATANSITIFVRGSSRTVRSPAFDRSSSIVQDPLAMPYAMPARLKCFFRMARPMKPPTTPVTKHAASRTG